MSTAVLDLKIVYTSLLRATVWNYIRFAEFDTEGRICQRSFFSIAFVSFKIEIDKHIENIFAMKITVCVCMCVKVLKTLLNETIEFRRRNKYIRGKYIYKANYTV